MENVICKRKRKRKRKWNDLHNEVRKEEKMRKRGMERGEGGEKQGRKRKRKWNHSHVKWEKKKMKKGKWDRGKENESTHMSNELRKSAILLIEPVINSMYSL